MFGSAASRVDMESRNRLTNCSQEGKSFAERHSMQKSRKAFFDHLKRRSQAAKGVVTSQAAAEDTFLVYNHHKISYTACVPQSNLDPISTDSQGGFQCYMNDLGAVYLAQVTPSDL